MADFTGKNILVLGGSRDIGAAIVRRFARGGGKVAFTYAGSTGAAEALAAETGAEAIRIDSADRDALITTVASRGALDVLVANAGTLVMGDPLTLGRYGDRRITAMLRADGWRVNAKRVPRIWRREGLKVPRRQPKRGRLWRNDGSCIRLRPCWPGHVWADDFVQDRTSGGPSAC